MKTLTRLASAAAVFATIVLGQGFRPRSATPPDPAMMIANQVARLTTLLDLTTSQASQITTILTNTQATITALQTTLANDQTALNTAITTNATGTIDTTAAAIGTAQGQVLDARSKAAAAIYVLLTSAQQAKVATFGLGILTGPGGPGGRGGPGGPPRPGE